MALLEPSSASSTRPIPASTSTRCGSSPTASTRCARPERAFLVITHYQRLLDYIVPDVVHVMSKGRIVKTGGKELALELEERLRRSSKTRPRDGDRGHPLKDRGRAAARDAVRRIALSLPGKPAAIASAAQDAFAGFEA
jgi:ABC-type multidrug transport system ATPase subunit